MNEKELIKKINQIRLLTFKGFASNDSKVLARTLSDIRNVCSEVLDGEN